MMQTDHLLVGEPLNFFPLISVEKKKKKKIFFYYLPKLKIYSRVKIIFPAQHRYIHISSMKTWAGRHVYSSCVFFPLF